MTDATAKKPVTLKVKAAPKKQITISEAAKRLYGKSEPVKPVTQK